MALQPRRLFIDVQNRTFIASPNSNLPSANPTWIDEDVESLEIYAVRPIGDTTNAYAFVDLSSATVKFAVGTTSPAALQTSFTPISTAVTLTVTETQAGGSFGGSLDEIQTVTWSGATPASGSFAMKFTGGDFTAIVPAGTTIYRCANHGLHDGFIITHGSGATLRSFRVVNAGQSTFSVANIGSSTPLDRSAAGLSIGPNDEVSFKLTQIVTPAIPYNASIETIQQAIVDAGFAVNGIPQVLVSGESGKQIQLYYAGRNGQKDYSPVVIVNSSLAGAPGVRANVSYNTNEIAALVAAGTTAVTMEVEISEGANRQTFRQSATLSPDLISSTSPLPAPANTATSFNIQSPDGSVFVVSVTNDGELMLAEVP